MRDDPSAQNFGVLPVSIDFADLLQWAARLDHCHDAGADRLGQFGPTVDDYGQIRVIGRRALAIHCQDRAGFPEVLLESTTCVTLLSVC